MKTPIRIQTRCQPLHASEGLSPIQWLLIPLLLAVPPGLHAQQSTQQTEAARSVERGAPQTAPPPVTEQAADPIDHARDGLPTPVQGNEDPMSSRPPPALSQAVASSPEPAAGSTLWMQLDRDQDGRISATESRADAGFSTRFASLDANSDGFVTDAEYHVQSQGVDKP